MTRPWQINGIWCNPDCRKGCGLAIQFLDEGYALLDRKAVASEIQGFIINVMARLESQQVTGTVLTVEWQAVEDTSAAEKDFCETAGALGLDPYDLEDKQADEIVTVARRLPQDMKREFFLAADAPRLARQARWVAQCLDQLAENKTKTRWAGKKGLFQD